MTHLLLMQWTVLMRGCKPKFVNMFVEFKFETKYFVVLL